jgi:alkylhydroperoxidase/carboxymuconolactone decarboxylase family protein YurZ
VKTEAEKQAFKRAYIEARGYWVEFNEGLLEHSPEWLEAYLAYSSAPARAGPLSARMRELIYVAVDGSTTHLFAAGLEVHIRIALDIGCSPAELVEVLQIATLQGLDSVALGMGVLAQEFAARGTPFNGAQDWFSVTARVSPEWASALESLRATADRTSRLTVRERALIRLALAASPTHLNESAVRVEVRAALDAEASAQEIAQVFQLVAHLGLHACTDGIPAVLRALAERQEA